MGRVYQGNEVADGAELRQDLVEVPDVIAAVTQGRIVERGQPDAIDTQPLQIVQALHQAAQIAGTVGGAVVERPDQYLVEDRVFEPGWVGGQRGRVAEILGIGVFDHTSLDVAALGWIVLDGVGCLVHQFHDATGTRGATIRITPRSMRAITPGAMRIG